MGEPKAITYKEVAKSAASPAEAWAEIGRVTGAGTIPLDADGNASIDLTDASDAVREKVDRITDAAKPANKPKEGK